MEQVDDRGRGSKVKASVIGGIVSQQAAEIAEMEALHDEQKADIERQLAAGLIAGPNKQAQMSELLGVQLEEIKSQKQQVIIFFILNNQIFPKFSQNFWKFLLKISKKISKNFLKKIWKFLKIFLKKIKKFDWRLWLIDWLGWFSDRWVSVGHGVCSLGGRSETGFGSGIGVVEVGEEKCWFLVFFLLIFGENLRIFFSFCSWKWERRRWTRRMLHWKKRRVASMRINWSSWPIWCVKKQTAKRPSPRFDGSAKRKRRQLRRNISNSERNWTILPTKAIGFVLRHSFHLFSFQNDFSAWNQYYFSCLIGSFKFFGFPHCLTHIPTHWFIDWFTTDWSVNQSIDWLIDRLIDRLIDWLIDQSLVDWLIDWLIWSGNSIWFL